MCDAFFVCLTTVDFSVSVVFFDIVTAVAHTAHIRVAIKIYSIIIIYTIFTSCNSLTTHILPLDPKILHKTGVSILLEMSRTT